MRDSFDHYYDGWVLDPENPDPQWPALVSAVGAFLTKDAAAAEAWRTFAFDGKKECFFHFVRLARDAGALPAALGPLLTRLKAAYPRSFA